MMIELTGLLWKGETLVKKPVSVNSSKVNYIVEVDVGKEIPIIGEENTKQGVSLSFSGCPPLTVMGTVPEIVALLNG